MRYPCLIGTLFLAAAGCSGKPAPETAAVDASRSQVTAPADSKTPIGVAKAEKPADRDDRPIPQDPAKAENRHKEWLEWNIRTTVGAYDTVGKRDPRWDGPARKAVDLAIRLYIETGNKITLPEINGEAKAALDAGCDDPRIAYLYALTMSGDSQTLLRERRNATRAFAASRYPAFRRAASLESFATQRLGVETPDAEARKEIEADLDASLALLAEGARSDERNGFWVDKWHDTIIDVIKDYRKLGMVPEAAYGRADAKMADIPELEVMRLMVRGTFWYHYGWEARTTAFAPRVPEGGFESLNERLGVAKEAFEGAWKLRPDSDYVAQRLVEIDKSIGGDRANMELWFDRAMRANGDSRTACWSKLDWLDPKWHGSPEELLAFGRRCRDTKNSRSGITLLCADAHWRVASIQGRYPGMHLGTPDAWADIRSVYDEYLKHHPEDDVARNKYAVLCHLSAHFRDAEVQYVALGGRLAQWSESPWVPLGQLKQSRERNARIVMGKEGLVTIRGWQSAGGADDDGEWHVNIPVAAPHREEPGILGADTTHVWKCGADGVAYELRILDLPPALRDEAHGRVLDAARAVVAKERGARPRDPGDTLLAARLAQEYAVDLPGSMQARVKAIVIGNRLYELSVAASKGDVTGKAANEFFDSFAFQPKTSPEAGKP